MYTTLDSTTEIKVRGITGMATKELDLVVAALTPIKELVSLLGDSVFAEFDVPSAAVDSLLRPYRSLVFDTLEFSTKSRLCLCEQYEAGLVGSQCDSTITQRFVLVSLGAVDGGNGQLAPEGRLERHRLVLLVR